MAVRAPAPISVDDGAPIAAAAPRLQDSDLGHLRRVLVEIKKALKTAMFNRHRTDQFESYIAGAHGLLSAFLEIHKVCEVKLEVSTFVVGDTPLLEDDHAENNIIYPLWASGVRLLIFKEGVPAVDLLRFFMTVVDYKRGDKAEDLATVLWKSDFRGIEWVVVQEFDIGGEAEDETREVEIEVEKVLSFLQDRLRSDSEDSIGFARVSVADLDVKLQQLEQIRSTVASQTHVDRLDKRSVQQEIVADERQLLAKITAVLLDVMRMPSSERELDDIEHALGQLLDGLILEGQFGMVDRLLEHCDALARDGALPAGNREMARHCGESLFMSMHDGQRVRAIATALNTGRTKDLEGLKRYLTRLGPTVTLLLLDLLDNLNAPQHRRLVADTLVAVGQQGVPMFARRMPSASSNLAKDLLYIIDRIDPPNKVELFAPILKHENAVLRMEGLTTIGRTKDQACFNIIHDVFANHAVPQMRAHAARLLAEYPAEWAEPVLLGVARDPKFHERAEGEQRALFAALVRLESAAAVGFVRALLSEKSSMLRPKVDDRKLMAISALQATPGMPSLQLLAEVAKDEKLHSKDVSEAARSAALEVKKRLLGGTPGGGAA
jgi:hypothetical protein